MGARSRGSSRKTVPTCGSDAVNSMGAIGEGVGAALILPVVLML